ncbi:MAG: hypothetical protein ABR552_05675 [Actinomycetota bacterium]
MTSGYARERGADAPYERSSIHVVIVARRPVPSLYGSTMGASSSPCVVQGMRLPRRRE